MSIIARVPLAGLCFFSAAYNLNIYASSQQGVRFAGGPNFLLFSSREMLILAGHI